jgi:hypothetical protein
MKDKKVWNGESASSDLTTQIRAYMRALKIQEINIREVPKCDDKE